MHETSPSPDRDIQGSYLHFSLSVIELNFGKMRWEVLNVFLDAEPMWGRSMEVILWIPSWEPGYRALWFSIYIRNLEFIYIVFSHHSVDTILSTVRVYNTVYFFFMFCPQFVSEGATMGPAGICFPALMKSWEATAPRSFWDMIGSLGCEGGKRYYSCLCSHF